MVNLYPFQTELIQEVRKNLQHKNLCVVSPCGSGKSIIQGMIAKRATDKGNRVLFLVHRKELVDQIYKTFKLCGVNFDLCHIGMVQTVTRNLSKQQKPSIIITDENHHCLAKSYTKIYDHFSEAFKIGFTATPVRLGGKGLHPVYNKMIIGPTVKWLIDNNYLSKYKLYSKKLVDTTNLHIRQGEYKKDEVNEMMELSTIYGDTVDNYKKLAMGKKTIAYCSSIKASKQTTEQFCRSGIIAKHLDAKTPPSMRSEIIQNFRDGKIQVLCNVDLFGEGFDVPDCECTILLRPTKSLSLYIQQSMRSMRYKEGKQSIIIDHVGNCYEHGLPDSEIEWTLADQEKKKKKDEEIEKIKECKECFAVYDFNKKACPICGAIPPQVERKDKIVIPGELEEINGLDVLKTKPFRHIYKLKTLKRIIDFVEAKKYKPGVIYRQLKERQDLKISEFDLKRIQKLANYRRGWWTHYKNRINIGV